MVGVPRSKGCLTCVQRRVKCDESRPGCHRCEKRGIPCSGYTRNLRFRFYSDPRATELRERLELNPDQHHVNLVCGASMDGMVAPRLAGNAVAHRYREGFCDFVEANFPGQFFGYSTHVGTNWFDIVRNNEYTVGHALDWSLRSIGALHIGRSQGDVRLGFASREMYGHTLNQLAQALNNPKLVTADSTLATAILLGAYELTYSAAEKSWMLHLRGISKLYQLRGPQAHADGLGRTLLSSFRGFLVYEALIRGERCFLEGEEWKSIFPSMIKHERRRGQFSRLGELIEYSFHEIAHCPGFLAETRGLVASADTTDRERESLMTSISNCQRALLDYQFEVNTGINASLWPTSIRRREFFGSIPCHIQDALAEFSLRGITSAIALLQQLLVILRSDGSRRSTQLSSNHQQQKNRWEDLSCLSSLKGTGGMRHHQPSRPSEHGNMYTWLDRVSMTMGILMDT